MSNLARPAALSSAAIVRSFGGAAPTGREGSDTRGRLGFVATSKEVGRDLAAGWPQLTSHGLFAALDKSALGAKVRQFTSFEASSVGMVATAALAFLAPQRRVRRAAIQIIMGLLHLKLHEPASTVPQLVSGLMTKKSPPQNPTATP